MFFLEHGAATKQKYSPIFNVFTITFELLCSESFRNFVQSLLCVQGKRHIVLSVAAWPDLSLACLTVQRVFTLFPEISINVAIVGAVLPQEWHLSSSWLAGLAFPPCRTALQPSISRQSGEIWS